MALAGTAMLFLSSASNTLMFETNNAYLRACQRNLITSGLAWAKTNIQKESSQSLDKMIELDVTDLNILNASLDVSISRPADEQANVRLITSCSRGRLNLKIDNIYKIE